MTPELLRQLQTILQHQQAGRSTEAESLALSALDHWPNQPQLLLVLGLICTQQRRFEEAIRWLRQAVTVSPGDAKMWSNYGYALKSAGKIQEAMSAYDRGVELEPSYLQGRHNRAVLLAEMHRIDEALRELDVILQANPDWGDAHFSRALALLLVERFEEGWAEFEWLWRAKAFPYWKRVFPQPIWDGSSTAGKTILLHGDQGFGDAIQFVRYAAPLAARGARVIVEAHPALMELFAGVAGVSAIVRHGDELPAFDFHAPLLAMPRLLRTTLQTIPADVPYLSVDPVRREAWKARLAEGGEGQKVGIVWAGNPDHTRDLHRSLRFEELSGLFSAAPVKWFSLQVGKAVGSLAGAPRGVQIVDLSPHIRDFSDTAAAVSALDLLISVDTSVAHLAGALARPVWLFLPFCPDFRWMLERNDSPWYPTMRLFREKRFGDRAPVIAEMAAELARWAKAPRTMYGGC
jgi:hypothetical protein